MKYNFYEKLYPNGKMYYHLEVDKLTDEEYDNLKPVFEHFGGHWRERYKCFVFADDIRDKLEDYKFNGIKILAEYIWQEQFQFYPTPYSVALRVVELADIKDGDCVLEPSAGIGSLVDCIDKDCAILCIEPMKEHVAFLTERGYVTCNSTFEKYFDPSIQYDKIIMNPPYAKQKDVQHTMMAFQMLKKGGTLVSIVSENALYYKTKLSDEFREFLKDNDAMIESVPTRAFEASGTTIETVIVKIVKK